MKFIQIIKRFLNEYKTKPAALIGSWFCFVRMVFPRFRSADPEAGSYHH